MLKSKKVQMALAGLITAVVLALVPELEAAGMEQQTADMFLWIVRRAIEGTGGLIALYAGMDALTVWKGLQDRKAPPAREVNLGDATH